MPRGPLPTSLTTAGLGEEEPGGGAAGLAEGGRGDTHRKRHCSWSCDSKKHRMPSSPPDNCGRCGGSRRSRAHSWEGRGSKVQAKGPAPRPGPQGCRSVGPADHPCQSHSNSWKSLAHPPTCVQSAQSPFQGISYSPSSSNGTSSRKSLPPQPGSDAPLSAHTASLGFPHCSPDFPESPPSTRV